MKELKWVGSANEDLAKFPKDVIQEFGYALYLAQKGERYDKAKRFRGFLSRVYEIAVRYDTDAYRVIYILLRGRVYLLHAFQKRSKRGIKTPREEIGVIKERIKFLKKEVNERRS